MGLLKQEHDGIFNFNPAIVKLPGEAYINKTSGGSIVLNQPTACWKLLVEKA